MKHLLQYVEKLETFLINFYICLLVPLGILRKIYQPQGSPQRRNNYGGIKVEYIEWGFIKYILKKWILFYSNCNSKRVFINHENTLRSDIIIRVMVALKAFIFAIIGLLKVVICYTKNFFKVINRLIVLSKSNQIFTEFMFLEFSKLL